ncbi:ABC transporter permease [Proteiniclasticum sp. C24MP]|uniref:ABC transporter permease n=1 Tax=Proteiniclasticum sp. C24MP TaxID=3374101 RepID=UPI0037549F82
MENRRGIKAAFKKLIKNPTATLALILIVIVVLMVVLAPVLTSYGPEDQAVKERLLPGFWDKENSMGRLLGTDHLGRDTFSRLLYGGRITLIVALAATALGLTAGVLLGVLAGYFPKLDNPIMRLMDVLFTFPGILLAMLIVAMLGVSTLNATIAISIWSIPSFARMVRSKVLSVKQEEFIVATRTLGANDFRIILYHILPNIMGTIIVIATMRLASSIMSIATLSFLGLGTPPPAPEWGGMIATAKEYMWDRPSLIIIPGIVVMILVISFNVLGDKLTDLFDPSLKENA